MPRGQRKQSQPRRPLPGLLALAGLTLLYGILIGHRGIGHYRTLSARLAARSDEAAQRVVRNRAMAERLAGLRSDPKLLEEAARSTLGVVGSDEMVLVFRDARARHRP